MKKKLFLSLTDDTIILYRETHEKLFTFKNDFDAVRPKLESLLLSMPHISLSLLIDRNHHDIHEENLPSLLPWDRIRYLMYKKAEWAKQGGNFGFHIFKQDHHTYLRWVHINPQDPLNPWISWISTLPHPKKCIFFMPLEAGEFLKKHFSSPNSFHCLVYLVTPHQVRHVIFKGKRLLLSRLVDKKEDLKASLHFLSRTYPDIYENLQILNLIRDIPLEFSDVLTLPDSQAFLHFVSMLNRPTLSIQKRDHSKWSRRGGITVFLSAVIGMGILLYQALHDMKQTSSLMKEIQSLQVQEDKLNAQLQGQDVTSLRKAWESYHHLNSFSVNPMGILNNLSLLLEKEEIRLEHFKWHHREKVEIEMSLLLKDKKGTNLAIQFDKFLNALKKHFPKSQIHVLEAPYNSNPHETFENPSETSLPLAHIKVLFP